MNSSGAPAPYESRDQYGEASGDAVMNLMERNIRARDVVTLEERWKTPPAWWPAPAASTNAGLHLPAIAHEAGIDFDLDDVCEIFRDTPYFVDPEAGRQIRRQGPLRGRRRARGDEGAAQGRADSTKTA